MLEVGELESAAALVLGSERVREVRAQGRSELYELLAFCPRKLMKKRVVRGRSRSACRHGTLC